MWEKIKLLGSGNSGAVYVAMNKHIKAVAAVKSTDLIYAANLKKEAKLLKQLQGNPYVIQCYGEDVSFEAGRGERVYNLFMELADAGSLVDLMKAHDDKNKMPESDVACYSFMLLKALSYLHGKGVIHGDIKPDNILVFKDKEGKKNKYLKLADFGASSTVDEIGKHYFGDVCYAPPEVYEDGIEGTSADIWSLGFTILMMLNGGEALRKGQNYCWETEISNYVSENGKDFLMKIFQISPSSRWTADQLLNHPFIQDNLKEDIPSLDLKQRDLMEKRMNPFGGWRVTKGLFSKNSRPPKFPIDVQLKKLYSIRA